MSALRLLVRGSLRTSRRSILGLALVIALAGAVALTALAGARRTASAFPRYLADSQASDVALNIVSNDQAFDGSAVRDAALAYNARARELPEVASDASYVGLETVVVTDATGQFADVQPEVLGSLDGRFIDQDKVAVADGRIPRAGSEDEVFINGRLARGLGLHLGSKVHLAVYDLSVQQVDDPSQVDPVARPEVRVVGIGQFPDEVLGDDVDGTGRILTTPAFTEAYRGHAGSYVWQGLRLVPGTRVDEAIAAYEALLPDNLQVNIQRSDVQRDRVQRSVRPVVVALAAFGIASALAVLALGALGALRLVGTASGDASTLRALGLTPVRTWLVVGAPAMAACVVGALGAVGLAYMASPVAPVGPVRAVEPARGLDLDATILLVGGLSLLLLLGVVTLASARQNVARERSPQQVAVRPSWLVARFAGLGLGPAAVVGARHALGGDGRRGGPPSRATLLACTVSVIAVATALTFGASVRSLLDTPAHYGWDATVAIQSGGGYDEVDLHAADEAAHVRGVEGLTIAGFAPLQVKGDRVNAIGVLTVEGDTAISRIRGSLPDKPDEVALGASTARDLHLGIGDQLPGVDGPLRVTGIVALPAIGPLASAHPSLGQGALLTLEGLVAQDKTAYPSLAFVRLAPGLDPGADGVHDGTSSTAGAVSVGKVYAALTHHPPEQVEAYPVLRPAEVVGLQPASRTANLLAGVLGAASVLALALTLGSSVRRRAPTYAVLSSLGFDREEIRRTVRWQTNIVTLLALGIGGPLGVVAGRVAWTAFADQLGAAGGPRVPLGLLGLAALALLVLSNLVGEWPARQATHRTSVQPLHAVG